FAAVSATVHPRRFRATLTRSASCWISVITSAGGLSKPIILGINHFSAYYIRHFLESTARSPISTLTPATPAETALTKGQSRGPSPDSPVSARYACARLRSVDLLDKSRREGLIALGSRAHRTIDVGGRRRIFRCERRSTRWGSPS